MAHAADQRLDVSENDFDVEALLTKSSAPDSRARSKTSRFSWPERISKPSCLPSLFAHWRACRQTSKPSISGMTTSTTAM